MLGLQDAAPNTVESMRSERGHGWRWTAMNDKPGLSPDLFRNLPVILVVSLLMWVGIWIVLEWLWSL